MGPAAACPAHQAPVAGAVYASLASSGPPFNRRCACSIQKRHFRRGDLHRFCNASPRSPPCCCCHARFVCTWVKRVKLSCTAAPRLAAPVARQVQLTAGFVVPRAPARAIHVSAMQFARPSALTKILDEEIKDAAAMVEPLEETFQDFAVCLAIFSTSHLTHINDPLLTDQGERDQ